MAFHAPPIDVHHLHNTSHIEDSASKYKVSTGRVDGLLNLNEKAKEQLDKIKLLDFNIFALQQATSNNELVSTTAYILAAEDLFANL